jgi:D-xylose transport system substrate-binding protein
VKTRFVPLRPFVAVVGCLAVAIAIAACGSSSSTSSSSAPTETSSSSESSPASSESSGGGYKIGLLLPETKVPRYESKDKPYFEEKITELCPDCEVLFANANSNQSEQQNQANSMLSQGAEVLVDDPYDGAAAASIVAAAAAKEVPVVAYDRSIESPDLAYLISNDYVKVGELQGEALVEKLKEDGIKPGDGGILMLNGEETDPNAHTIKQGALSKIEPSGYKVLAEIDTWDPTEAQNFTASQISKFGDEIVGVYSANDGNAGGAIAALKAADTDPMPPITGLDASVEGLQAILAGNQYMTTYNAFRSEAYKAAEVALELAEGKTPKAEAQLNGHPASLNPPVAVTLDDIESTVIKDEFYEPSEICTSEFKKACEEAGIQ